MSRELGTEISSVEGKLSTIEKWLNDNKLEDTSLLPKLDLPIYSEQDEKQLRSLQVEFENITQTNKKINTNNYWKEQLQLIDLDKYKMVYGEVESYDELQEELGKWRGVAFQSKFEGTDEEVCPTCGQDVDNNLINQMQENQEKEINEAEKEIQSIREEIATIKSNNEIINERDSKRKEWEDCYRSIDQGLPSEILSAENLQQSIDDLEATISKQKERLQEVIEENTSRERHNTRIGIIEEQTQEFENELNYFMERLNLIQDKLSCTDILKKAFSTNGLLAYKIENLVKDLEELTNEYLAELSDGRFNLQFVVLNDKLNVELDDNGKPVDILSLSAGELARVNTSTLLAIRKLMSSISKSRINVLFLDEVTNVLDETGKEKIVEILLGEEELNTYIVSHGWTHPLLSKVEVIKTNDISRLE